MNEHRRTASAAQRKAHPNILQLPRAPLPQGQTARTYFRQLCREGLTRRYGEQPDLTAAARLEDEISVIAELQLENYFLIVAEYVNFAKGHGIMVGPGRGSSPSSLVCYCLGITEIDPLRHGLHFARFVSCERALLPDIDIDVSGGAYPIMRQHLAHIYGKESVFNCVYYPQAPEGAAANIPVVHHGNVFLCEHGGTAELPFTDISGERVCAYTVSELEKLGYIKFDILDLGQLSRIGHCLATIAAETNKIVDLQAIDYADPQVFSLLASGDTKQIYQFASKLMVDFLRQFKPNCLEDLVLAFVLDRPGTVSLMPEVIRRKQEQNRQSDDVCLDAILADSYGLILYQEQIMEIFHRYGGFNYDQADMLRRALQKPHLRQQVKERFLHGAISCAEADVFPLADRSDAAKKAYAAKLLQRLRQADADLYPFMKAHAAAYATLAYRTAWLKCYYPRQYEEACR